MHDSDIRRSRREPRVGCEFGVQYGRQAALVRQEDSRSAGLKEEPANDAAQLALFGLGCREPRHGFGQAPGGYQDAAGPGESLQRSKRGKRHTLHACQDDDAVGDVAEADGAPVDLAPPGQHLVVKAVEAVAGVEHLAGDVRPKAAKDRRTHRNAAGGELCPGVVIGQVEGDVVCGCALAKQEAGALQIGGHLRHHDPPWVLLVEGARGVEAPAGVTHSFGRIGPAMADQLVASLEKVRVRRSLHVERCRAKDRPMEPGPRLAGGDLPSEQVARRGGPSHGPKPLPSHSLAFGQRRCCVGE